MSRFNTILIFSIIIFHVSCLTKKSGENIIREWHGKEIVFPKDIDRMVIGGDSANCNFLQKKYKILIYKDSSSCNRCNLHLAEWKNTISKIKEVSNIEFLFFITSVSKEEIYCIREEEEFYYPIILDEFNTINKLNQFPEDPLFHCFLLNSNNKVLLTGDPSNNSELWELYKKVILSK